MPFGKDVYCRLQLRIVPEQGAVAAGLSGKLNHRRRRIDAENLTTICTQDLRCDLTQQAQTYDTYKITEPRISLAHALNGNRPNVVNAPQSNGTESGSFTTRFWGTEMNPA